ncbi:hypothetical protein MMC30_009407 [Trapelia coarctata]|nr:hypothetical protein [Trapelia coarctata]
MLLARAAGVRVFATGGLGGVHKNGEASMDISADLTELGRTPVAVISSGCKSFLDIPRTLEYLETQGVGVATFLDGRTGSIEFPAFWTRNSGIPSPSVVQDEKEAAAIVYAQLNLPLGSGLLFANPIPEKYSLPKAKMDNVMAEAIRLAKENGVSGSGETPFILAKIRELTEGLTVTANRALVEANVERGSKVAVQLAKLEGKGEHLQTSKHGTSAAFQIPFSKLSIVSPSDEKMLQQADVLVAGSLAIDISSHCNPDDEEPGDASGQFLRPGTSNTAVMSQTLGGVGQNIATALHSVGTPVKFCSVVAGDLSGRAALSMLAARGLRVDGIETLKSGLPTALYIAFNDKQNELFMAMADMRIVESRQPYLDDLWKAHLEQTKPKWLILDANWHRSALRRWRAAAKAVGAKIAFEPVSTAKSCRIFDQTHRHTDMVQLADLATPNEMELGAMWGFQGCHLRRYYGAWSAIHLESLGKKLKTVATDEKFSRLLHMSLELLLCFPCILTKLGSSGVLLTELLREDDPRMSAPWAQQYIFAAEGSLQGRNIYGDLQSCDDSRQDLQPEEGSTQGKYEFLKDYVAIYIRIFPPAELVPAKEIVSVNGVGDTFLGILMAGLAKEKPKALDDLVMVAQKGSCMTLRSKESVNPQISSLRSLL